MERINASRILKRRLISRTYKKLKTELKNKQDKKLTTATTTFITATTDNNKTKKKKLTRLENGFGDMFF